MMNVSAATTASLVGANGAEGGTSASGDTALSAGQSPFQALLAPTIAAGDAAVSEASTANNAAAGREVADTFAQDAVEAADADGNDLPVAVTPPALLAVGATTVALRGSMASTHDAGTPRAAVGLAATADIGGDQLPIPLENGVPSNSRLERFSSGPHRLPVLGLFDAASAMTAPPGVGPGNTPLVQAVAGDLQASTPALPIDPADGEVPDAHLDRLSTGPHRLPPTAVAAFGAAQLLKFGEIAGRSPTAAVADPTRGAVGAGLSPAPTQATASAASVGTSAPAGFGQAPGSPAWGQALDQQVMLMLNRGAQEARIRLHPQELGQLDIRLSMGGDRVDLNFSVQHASVAGALQQHMPQLTQMLADQGLSLGQASVSHDQAQSGSSAGQNGQAQGGDGSLATQSDAEIETSRLLYQPATRGLLDIFA